jgi:uncharacterized protein YqgV (UPF0045/DUF77 family)
MYKLFRCIRLQLRSFFVYEIYFDITKVGISVNEKGDFFMNASVAIQILPGVSDEEELIRIVDEVIDYIKSTGLNYYVGPCETSIEGDYDTLMEIVKNCQYVAAKAGCKSMNTYVKISYKPEGDVLTIEKKVTKHHK